MSAPSDPVALESWIFDEPDASGNGSRWDWTDDWLLGDMRTFLVGAAVAHAAPDARAFGGRLGGGNLSIPVLFTMGLELLGRLHEGDMSAPGCKGYVGAYNVSMFMHHFAGLAKGFCGVLWELTRNGLHHSFRPQKLELELGKRPNPTLDYVLTCHPEHDSVIARMEESHYCIFLNAVDAVAALQAAVDDYARELRADTPAKRKYAAAFHALESNSYAPRRTPAEECAVRKDKEKSKNEAANVAMETVGRLEVGKGLSLFSDEKCVVRKDGNIRIEPERQVSGRVPTCGQTCVFDISLTGSPRVISAAYVSAHANVPMITFDDGERPTNG